MAQAGSSHQHQDSSSGKQSPSPASQMSRKRKRSDKEPIGTTDITVKKESEAVYSQPQSDFGSSHSLEYVALNCWSCTTFQHQKITVRVFPCAPSVSHGKLNVLGFFSNARFWPRPWLLMREICRIQRDTFSIMHL
jgi:hypothetical protein